jgi:exopolysaccharide biosynthesis polyprenyl glycosylphosphotransferase
MPVREVALDRDVRSQRLLPARSRYRRAHFARRTVSVCALITIDVGALALALFAAWLTIGGSTPWPGLTWPAIASWVLVLVVCAAVGGLYGRMYSRHAANRVFKVWMVAFVATSMLMLLVNVRGLGARFVATWAFAFLLALMGRMVFDWLVSLHYGVDGECPEAILLGSIEACARVAPSLRVLPPSDRVNVVGLVVPARQLGETVPAGADGKHPHIVGAQEDLASALAACPVSQVIIAEPFALNGQLRPVMDACRDSRVALKVIDADLAVDGQAVGYVPGLDCPLYVVRPQPAGPASYVVKRIVDRVGAGLLLALLSPVMLVVAIAIKLDSRGPVFFVDTRVGLGQRPFRFYKFRTMVTGAREAQDDLEAYNQCDGVLFKIHDDPRITRVGRLVRRFSLDEVPQFLNVVKGDMSLVGPRALPLRDYEFMEEWHKRRHVVLPGVTGLWQISGRSDLGFEDMLDLDLRYIETWSLRSDLYIVARTPGAVLFRRGAY